MTEAARSPLATARRLAGDPRVSQWGGKAFSVAILTGALIEMRSMDWHAIGAMIPRAPSFWLVFAMAYAAPVIADWTIYGRLWGIPLSGMQHLLRKLIGNELVFGYVGEAYLYAWATRSGRGGADAFRAVRDVAILSSAAGSIVTFMAALAVAPFTARLHLSVPTWAILAGLAVILAPPVAVLLFGKRVFSLPGEALARIVSIHFVRVLAVNLLTALAWHIVLPEIALTYWLALAAFKLVLSRLPLISNRELVFAGVTAALLGRGSDVAQLMAMMAAMTAATHVMAGLAVSAGDALETAARRTRVALRPVLA